MKYITTVNQHEYVIEILDDRHLVVDGQPFAIDFLQVGTQPVYSLLIGGESYEAHIYSDEAIWQVQLRGSMYQAQVEDERERRLRQALGGGQVVQGEFHLKAPMPGLVVAVPVSEGQEVQKGDVLLVLESMKMQNELKAPRAGAVTRIRVAPGDRVEQKQTMLSVV
jgi:biotin carboxyl carrier protein